MTQKRRKYSPAIVINLVCLLIDQTTLCVGLFHPWAGRTQLMTLLALINPAPDFHPLANNGRSDAAVNHFATTMRRLLASWINSHGEASTRESCKRQATGAADTSSGHAYPAKTGAPGHQRAAPLWLELILVNNVGNFGSHAWMQQFLLLTLGGKVLIVPHAYICAGQQRRTNPFSRSLQERITVVFLSHRKSYQQLL